MPCTDSLSTRRSAAVLTLVLALAALPLGPARAQDGGPQRQADDEPIRDSLFATPLYLGDEPPEVRSVRHVLLVHAEAVGAARNVTRTREEALELAASLRRAIVEGAEFGAIARRWSSSADATLGGVLGSFPPGVLQEQLDGFLFSAEVGEVSRPIDAPTGVHLLQRVDRLAGARGIRLDGDGDEVRARIAALRAEIEAGAPFEEVARRASEDQFSARFGGALGVFERGPADRLLKAAAFDLRVGEVSEPIRSPLGWHLVQRVPPEEIPPELVDPAWMEFRGIALLHSENPLGLPAPPRTAAEAAELARTLAAELEAGADFAELARRYDDDPSGGRERAGRFGWVHRQHPNLPQFMREAFRLAPGDWLGPQPTNVGWVFVERLR